MKLGIIRCMQTEDYCPGTTDFKAIREKTGAFEGTPIGYSCPFAKRMKDLAEKEVDEKEVQILDFTH